MANIKEILTRRIGPLPVWVWVSVPVGAYVIYSTILSRREPEEEPQEGGDIVGGDYMSGILPTMDHAGGFGPIPQGSSNVVDPSTIAPPAKTNETWKAEALAWGRKNNVPNTILLNSVTRYLKGDELLDRQLKTINQIITGIGYPPNPPKLIKQRPGSDAKAFKSEAAWRSTVLSWGTSKFGAIRTLTAVNRYLSDKPLGASGYPIIQRALNEVGTPPNAKSPKRKAA